MTLRNNKEHILLICNGFPYHKALADLGYRISILRPKENAKEISQSGQNYSHVSLFEGDNWKLAAEQLNAVSKIDLVFSFDEMYFRTGLELSEHLNLRYHLSLKLIENFEDKYLMRKAIQAEAGLQTIPVAICESKADIANFAEKHGYPIVLKPRVGMGSTGVSLIKDFDDIDEAIDWYNNKNDDITAQVEQEDMLVEAYIQGREFSVEAFSADGQHYPICTVQKYKEGKHFVGEGHLLPAPISKEEEDILFQTTRVLLDLLGYENGPSHTEIILSTDKKAVVVESHPRVSGAAITTTLIPLVFNFSFIDLWIRQQFDHKVIDTLNNAKAEGFASIRFQSVTENGKITAINGLDDAKNVPGIVTVGLNTQLGAYHHGLKDSYSRLCYAISKCNRASDTEWAAKSAVDKVSFVLE